MKQERRSKLGVCVYLVAHAVLCAMMVCLQNAKKPMFCFKMDDSVLILKIFVGYIEWEFRHPHVKYLSDQMILKF